MNSKQRNKNRMNADDTIDDFHWHEVIDRTWLVMETLWCALEGHPVMVASDELNGMYAEAHSALFKLYQRAAELAPTSKGAHKDG